jgi:hypothetical protein
VLVISGNERYTGSYIVALDGTTLIAGLTVKPAVGTYGTITAVYGIAVTNAVSNLTATTWDKLFFTSIHNGKGLLVPADYTAGTDPVIVYPCASAIFTSNATAGVVSISAPQGGVAQFRGLTQTTTEDLYVEVICVGVQPMFAAVAWQYLSTGSQNGLMVTCMTGIAQCAWANTNVALSAAASAACLNDPRYLTWRMMTLKFAYAGTLVWYRTDSYWDAGSNVAASTWGPGLKMSANYASSVDNNGSTDLGKTYVFTTYDGTGVQLNHLSFSTVGPSGYSSPGMGTLVNPLITAPTAFTKNGPSRVEFNLCSDSSMYLVG